jgi:outer membrane protein assembly factor BamA
MKNLLSKFGSLAILTLVFTSINSLSCFSQIIVVDTIILKGNKVTAPSVIYRELDIQIGDTIPMSTLHLELERNKKRLLSTGLFNVVNVNIINWDTQQGNLSLVFDLKENWYIYPSVIFEYADRSFNVWWKEHRLNFKRTNYGVRLDHLNLTGHKDRLKLKFQRGYTQKYEAQYTFPYFLGNWGLGGTLFYSTNKELGYKTTANAIDFFQAEDERVLFTRFRSGLSLTNRADAFNYHSFYLEYRKRTIDDLIAIELNPNYFLDGQNRVNYFFAEYDYQFDKRVFPTYPEDGYLLFVNLRKEGFGIFNDVNNLSIFGGFEKFFRLTPNLVYGGRVKAKFNVNRSQVAYINNNALGYGDEVRGYELYVIDGTDYFLAKTDLKMRVFQRIFDIKDFMFIDQFNLFPFVIWLRASIDAGYVNEPTYVETNSLSNRWLIGGGPGIDFLLYNNYKLSVEYNFNHLGESGFFFQAAFNF